MMEDIYLGSENGSVFFRKVKGTLVNGWGFASVWITALALMGAVKRLDLITWYGFIPHLVDFYHKTLLLSFSWVFNWFPFSVPLIVYDYCAIYFLFGNAYVLLRKQNNGTGNTLNTRKIILSALFWPVLHLMDLYKLLQSPEWMNEISNLLDKDVRRFQKDITENGMLTAMWLLLRRVFSLKIISLQFRYQSMILKDVFWLYWFAFVQASIFVIAVGFNWFISPESSGG